MESRPSLPGKDFLLEKLVTDFTLFIKVQCPESSVKVSEANFEDEDATVTVYPPSSWTYEQCSDLEQILAEKSIDILFETGYNLLVGVPEPV